MKRYILVFLIIAFACNSKDPRILDKGVIRDVMVDLHLSDAIIQINSVRSRSVQVKSSHYDSIISAHGITKEVFEWNVAYYTYHKELDNIMAGVIDTLNSMEGDLQKEMIQTRFQNPRKQQSK